MVFSAYAKKCMAAFGLAVLAAAVSPALAEEEIVQRTPLENADVLIPISTPRKTQEGYLAFEINKLAVNPVSYISAVKKDGNFGYYVSGHSAQGRECPFIPDGSKTFYKEERDWYNPVTIKITLGLPDELMNAILESQCAVGKSPPKGGAAGVESSPSP